MRCCWMKQTHGHHHHCTAAASSTGVCVCVRVSGFLPPLFSFSCVCETRWIVRSVD